MTFFCAILHLDNTSDLSEIYCFYDKKIYKLESANIHDYAF